MIFKPYPSLTSVHRNHARQCRNQRSPPPTPTTKSPESLVNSPYMNLCTVAHMMNVLGHEMWMPVYIASLVLQWRNIVPSSKSRFWLWEYPWNRVNWRVAVVNTTEARTQKCCGAKNCCSPCVGVSLPIADTLLLLPLSSGYWCRTERVLKVPSSMETIVGDIVVRPKLEAINQYNRWNALTEWSLRFFNVLIY